MLLKDSIMALLSINTDSAQTENDIHMYIRIPGFNSCVPVPQKVTGNQIRELLAVV